MRDKVDFGGVGDGSRRFFLLLAGSWLVSRRDRDILLPLSW